MKWLFLLWIVIIRSVISHLRSVSDLLNIFNELKPVEAKHIQAQLLCKPSISTHLVSPTSLSFLNLSSWNNESHIQGSKQEWKQSRLHSGAPH